MPDLYDPLRRLEGSLNQLQGRVLSGGTRDRASRVLGTIVKVTEIMGGDTSGGTTKQVNGIHRYTDRVAALAGTETAAFDTLFDQLESFLATL